MARFYLIQDIEKINELIVSGHGAEARRLLRSLVEKKVPRAERLSLATLARRSNLHGVALRPLNPVVRPTGKRRRSLTDKEKAEYAASLSYIGAAPEALAILRTVNADGVPESLLYQAFAHFSQWDYAAPIPLLRKYLQSSLITDYQRLIGKVNLLAASLRNGMAMSSDSGRRYPRADTGGRLSPSAWKYSRAFRAELYFLREGGMRPRKRSAARKRHCRHRRVWIIFM